MFRSWSQAAESSLSEVPLYVSVNIGGGVVWWVLRCVCSLVVVVVVVVVFRGLFFVMGLCLVLPLRPRFDSLLFFLFLSFSRAKHPPFLRCSRPSRRRLAASPGASWMDMGWGLCISDANRKKKHCRCKKKNNNNQLPSSSLLK